MDKISFFVLQILFFVSIAHADGTLMRPGSFSGVHRSLAAVAKGSSNSALVLPVVQRTADFLIDVRAGAARWFEASAAIFKLGHLFQQDMQKADEIKEEAERRKQLADELQKREKSWAELRDERDQRVKELREKILENRNEVKVNKDEPSEEDMMDELNELLIKPLKPDLGQKDEENGIAVQELGPGVLEQPEISGSYVVPGVWMAPGSARKPDYVLANERADDERASEEQKFDDLVDNVFQVFFQKIKDVRSFSATSTTPADFKEHGQDSDITRYKSHLKLMVKNYIRTVFQEPSKTANELAEEVFELCKDPAHGNRVDWKSIVEANTAVNLIFHEIVAPPILRLTPEIDFMAYAWAGTVSYFSSSADAIKAKRDRRYPGICDKDSVLNIDIKCFPFGMKMKGCITRAEYIKAALEKESERNLVAVVDIGQDLDFQTAYDQLTAEQKKRIIRVCDTTFPMRQMLNDGLVTDGGDDMEFDDPVVVSTIPKDET